MSADPPPTSPMLHYLVERLGRFDWPFPAVEGVKPLECFACPFATPLHLDDELRRPNPADPGEGYYRCSLLDKTDIWGEQPICTDEAWFVKMREEWVAIQARITD